MGEPATQEPAEDPRHALGEHIAAVRRHQALIEEIAHQWRHLKYIQEHEATARARLEAIKVEDAAELAEHIARPKGLHIVSDHDRITEAEFELTRTTRDADAARSCEPEVAERRNEALQRLELMDSETALLAAKVMLDEASTISAEITALTAQLREKHARIWGLKNYIGETAPLRRMQDLVPPPEHPDTISPDRQDVLKASKSWETFSKRLASDHWAALEE